jgi:hypothetical protein
VRRILLFIYIPRRLFDVGARSSRAPEQPQKRISGSASAASGVSPWENAARGVKSLQAPKILNSTCFLQKKREILTKI